MINDGICLKTHGDFHGDAGMKCCRLEERFPRSAASEQVCKTYNSGLAGGIVRWMCRHSFVGSQEKLDSRHLAALAAITLSSDIIVVMLLVTINIVFVCIMQENVTE